MGYSTRSFFSYMLFILKWGLFPTLIVFDMQWGRGSEPKTLPAPESVELSDNLSWVCFLFQIGIVPDPHNVCPAVRSGQRACHIPVLAMMGCGYVLELSNLYFKEFEMTVYGDTFNIYFD